MDFILTRNNWESKDIIFQLWSFLYVNYETKRGLGFSNIPIQYINDQKEHRPRIGLKVSLFIKLLKIKITNKDKIKIKNKD